MNVSLTKPLEDFVQTKVNDGMYASASEVIRAGLRVLVEKEMELEQKIKIGLEQADAGLGENFNDAFADKLIQKVQQRLSTNQST